MKAEYTKMMETEITTDERVEHCEPDISNIHDSIEETETAKEEKENNKNNEEETEMKTTKENKEVATNKKAESAMEFTTKKLLRNTKAVLTEMIIERDLVIAELKARILELEGAQEVASTITPVEEEKKAPIKEESNVTIKPLDQYKKEGGFVLVENVEEAKLVAMTYHVSVSVGSTRSLTTKKEGVTIKEDTPSTESNKEKARFESEWKDSLERVMIGGGKWGSAKQKGFFMANGAKTEETATSIKIKINNQARAMWFTDNDTSIMYLFNNKGVSRKFDLTSKTVLWKEGDIVQGSETKEVTILWANKEHKIEVSLTKVGDFITGTVKGKAVKWNTKKYDLPSVDDVKGLDKKKILAARRMAGKAIMAFFDIDETPEKEVAATTVTTEDNKEKDVNIDNEIKVDDSLLNVEEDDSIDVNEC